MSGTKRTSGSRGSGLPAALRSVIEAESEAPVHPAAEAMATAIASRHAGAALGVLFYGSCLRDDSVLRDEAEGVLDFYLIVENYAGAYQRTLLRAANRLLPPNVFYLEHDWHGRRLRAKYAVIALDQFERGVSPRSFNGSLWARFAQPVRLLVPRDADAARRIVACLAQAPVTLIEETAPLVSGETTPEALWIRAFEETYRTELRSEGRDRARDLVRHDAERYRSLTGPVLEAAEIAFDETPSRLLLRTGRRAHVWRWRLRRLQGKTLSVLRLLKSAFTFDGGLDYLMWKIERHSGVRVQVSDWQRRHPLLSAPALTWRLYRRGAFR
jgi:hypothetical protein